MRTQPKFRYAPNVIGVGVVYRLCIVMGVSRIPDVAERSMVNYEV